MDDAQASFLKDTIVNKDKTCKRKSYRFFKFGYRFILILHRFTRSGFGSTCSWLSNGLNSGLLEFERSYDDDADDNVTLLFGLDNFLFTNFTREPSILFLRYNFRKDYLEYYLPVLATPYVLLHIDC